ncbi:MAG: hypothetical protein ACE5HL_11000 [Terriglobia bacterium]
MTTRLPKFIFLLSIIFVLGLSASPAQASPTRIVSVKEILRRLVTLIGRLEKLNYQVEDIHLAVVTRRSYKYRQELHAGHAYMIVGLGDDRIRDLDISLYDESNYRVARDNDAQNIAVARVTPRRTERFITKVDAYEFNPGYTDGFFVIVTSRKRQTGRVVSTVNMLQRLLRTLRMLAENNFQTIKVQMGILAKGGAETYIYSLGTGIYWIVGVGDSRIGDLDIRVYNEKGKLIVKDNDPQNVAIAEVKSSRTGKVRVRVNAHRFNGRYRDGYFVIVTAFR